MTMILGSRRQRQAAPSGVRRGRHAILLAAAVALVGQVGLASLSFVATIARGPAPLAARHARSVGRLHTRISRASRGGEEQDRLEVGDKVKAMSPDDEQWYPGSVEKINDDGTFTVRWDDPDGGPETNDLGLDAVKKVIIFKDYVVGDDVQAMPPDDEHFYPGVVAKANADGTFNVKWDDPDGGPEAHDVKPEFMKKVTVFKDYKVDDVVEALFPEDGSMYEATVKKVNGDGTFTVAWADPDGGPEESVVKAKDMKYPPIPFDKLEVGQKYQGKVSSITGFGAFVEFGAETEGLVHISRIADHRIEDVSEYLEEGQEVTVWISGLRDDGKVGLTMVEGRVDGAPRKSADLSLFEGLSPDDWHTGVVARTASFGAFVTVTLESGESADGLVHISQIRDGFVDNVDDELSQGQEVQVRVQSVDIAAGRMSLTMKEGWGGPARAPADVSPFEGMESQWLKGTVARVASFGLFVTIKHPDNGKQADGLVHITEIREGFVENAEDEAEVGQEVDVWIKSVDTFSNKIALSMKKADAGGGDEY